jgi:hypothetical protein
MRSPNQLCHVKRITPGKQTYGMVLPLAKKDAIKKRTNPLRWHVFPDVFARSNARGRIRDGEHNRDARQCLLNATQLAKLPLLMQVFLFGNLVSE